MPSAGLLPDATVCILLYGSNKDQALPVPHSSVLFTKLWNLVALEYEKSMRLSLSKISSFV